jgi:glycosyltransferase involved in cell wall biosynthesis
MSRILLVGHAPFDQTALRRYAGQLRTLHLLEALRGAGHKTLIVGGRIPETFAGSPPEEAREADALGAEVRSAAPGRLESGEAIRRAIADFHPEAIVGAGTWPSACACLAADDLPVWADLHGDAMAEGQAKAFSAGDDAFLSSYAWRAWTCFLRADRFSTVSRRQRLAALGQLSLAGRHGRATFGHNLVEVIPSVPEILPPATMNRLRGRLYPEDAVALLWLGGWNNWADVETCFAGVDEAMRRDPRLHFVATGGAIAGHEEEAFGRFARLVAGSSRSDRYHLLGWLEAAEVARAIDDADIALVVDLPCLETELGCRTRLATVMTHGLAAVATEGAEIVADATAAGAAMTIPPRAPLQLAETIVALAADAPRRRRMSEAARRFAAARTPFATAAPLLAWVRAPRRAPDALSGRARPDPLAIMRGGVESAWRRFRRAGRADGWWRAMGRALRHLGIADHRR